MVRPKRRVTSSKVPQKVALPAYNYSPSKSSSPDEAPQSPGSADSDRGELTPPGTPDQDEDPNESGTDQSHATSTSSSGDFPRMPVRPRQRFTADETNALEQVYRRNKRPSNEIKQRLARRFSTSMSRIQIWFQNRRAKEKKNSNNSGTQRTSTAANEQNEDDSDKDISPEQTEPSTTAATSSPSSKRQGVSRKSSASPPSVAESSSSANKKRKKQKMPAIPAASPAVSHPYPPSRSYTLTYPGFATTPMQPMDPSNVSNTPMDDSLLYPSHPPQHASHARGFIIPKFDWHHPHFINPIFAAAAFQGSHPADKHIKYVDPKKVIKPESSQPVLDHMNEQSTTSNVRPPPRKGKQKKRATEMVNSDSEYGSSEEQVTGDL